MISFEKRKKLIQSYLTCAIILLDFVNSQSLIRKHAHFLKRQIWLVTSNGRKSAWSKTNDKYIPKVLVGKHV